MREVGISTDNREADVNVSYATLAEEIYHEGHIRGTLTSMSNRLTQESVVDLVDHRDVICSGLFVDVAFEGKDSICESPIFARLHGVYGTLYRTEWAVESMDEAEAIAQEVQAALDEWNDLVNDFSPATEDSPGSIYDYVRQSRIDFCDSLESIIYDGFGTEERMDSSDTGDMNVSEIRQEQLEHALETNTKLRDTCFKT